MLSVNSNTSTKYLPFPCELLFLLNMSELGFLVKATFVSSPVATRIARRNTALGTPHALMQHHTQHNKSTQEDELVHTHTRIQPQGARSPCEAG